jgi:hypothetical protein
MAALLLLAGLPPGSMTVAWVMASKVLFGNADALTRMSNKSEVKLAAG